MNPLTERLAVLAAAIEQLPVGLVLFGDPAGRIVFGNVAAREILGLLPGERFAGRLPVLRTVHGRTSVPEPNLPWNRALKYGEKTASADYEVLRRDGTRRVVTISAAPLHGTGGTVDAAVASLADVTYLRTQACRVSGERDLLAALMAREQQVARTLEKSHLPQRLPTVPGYTLSGVYLPPRDGSSVGGDWYDAFFLADGRVGFSIGDVMGHGLDAAVLMNRLRFAMHSAAFANPVPAAMLDVANAMLKEDGGDGIATALAGILDPSEATLTFATAGHPLPLLRKSAGHLVAFDGAAPPLGVYERGDAEHHFAHLDRGDIAVFYTDGLVEVSRDADAGEALLRALLLSLNDEKGDHAAALSLGVIGAAIPEDDVAVLTIVRDRTAA